MRTVPAGRACNFHIWKLEDVELRNGVAEFWQVGDGFPSSVACLGNIIVSAFEAVDRENQLVVNSAWGSEEIFIAYRQMRREIAPNFARPFLVDDIIVRGTIVDADPRAS
jgi:hypothetical protein